MDQATIIALLLALFISVEALNGRFFKPAATIDDRIVEIFSTLIVPLVVVPSIFLVTNGAMSHLFPHAKDTLSEHPVWVLLLILIIGDDMVQYWWHRMFHSIPALFNLHRAHHEPRYISVRVVYRNGFLYYSLLFPLYISAVLIYLGLGHVYMYYGLTKVLVILGAHCAVPWDKFLYKNDRLSWLAWIVERTISTPSTHHAHHGMNVSDGVTNFNGNYGNLLFLWDVIFGTAKITRDYPNAYGVPDDRRPTFLRQIFFPFLRSWKT